MKTFKIILVAFCLLIIINTPAFSKAYRVGVITDKEKNNYCWLTEKITQELAKAMPSNHSVILENVGKASSSFEDEAAIQALILDTLKNPNYDAVLALGPISSHTLASMRVFKKPALATHIINGKIQGLGNISGTSGIRNLSYIDLNIELLHLIQTFKTIKNFSSLHLIASPNFLRAVPHLSEYLSKETANQGITLHLIETNQSIVNLKNQLKDAEAAMIAPILGSPFEHQQKIIDLLNELKIPSMATLGRNLVEEGVLCSLSPDVDNQKLARRIALNLQRTFSGMNPRDFSLEFTMPERLAFNLSTASKIGVYPSWEQMIDAVLYNDFEEKNTVELNLSYVVDRALTSNLQLIAQKSELEAQSQKLKGAKAMYEPGLKVSAQHITIDKDRADSIITPAERSAKLGAELTWLLRSEKANANIGIQKLFSAIKTEEERALMLDLVKDALQGYIDILRANTMLNIQKDNLEVTRSNLEMAKLRERVGSSGPAEIYRWEIQMASARQGVVSSEGAKNKAELFLKQLLNLSQEKQLKLEPFDLDKDCFYMNYKQIEPLIGNPQGFKTFGRFMVAEAFEFSPELVQLERNLEVLERLRRSERAEGREPSVGVKANFTRTFDEAGVGRVKSVPAPFNSVFKIPDNNDWFVGVEASLPIFEGGRRKAKVREYEAGIEGLRVRRQLVADRLELNTLACLEDTKASYSHIRLAKTRAEFAAKTLELVQSAYSRGAISILDLIDAQNAFLVSTEGAAAAKFAFVKDFVALCRAVGSFDIMLSPTCNADWQGRIKGWLEEKGLEAKN